MVMRARRTGSANGLGGASHCAEFSNLGAQLNSANSDNYVAGTYSDEKGGLGFRTTPQVFWRLPSRDDWYRADVDGIRFVLPRVANGWTSTVNSFERNLAWFFLGDAGHVARDDRGTGIHGVQCVSRPVAWRN